MSPLGICLLGFHLFLGLGSTSNQENYISFHQSFAEVEKLLVEEKFYVAGLKLDTLFQKYPVKFAKDYVIAAQVSLINHNQQKAIKYLKEAMRKGVKLECLCSIKLIEQSLSDDDWIELELAAYGLRKKYLKQINLGLYKEFHNRYQHEQDAKRTDRYKAVVYSNLERIAEISKTHEFPGQDLIGTDNQAFAPSISDCDCGNSKVIVTLLHYDYPIKKLGLVNLINEVKNGNLHPREFATIFDYEKSRLSVLYKFSDKEYFELPTYNFNFPFGEKISDLVKVNQDRKRFGICEYEVDQKKYEIGKKYGMKLIFNYQ